MSLYRDGFVIRKKSAIKTRSFYGIVNTLLGEGRLGHLSEEQRSQLKEFYMLARLQIYDRYLAEGRLATSSRVLAIYEEHHRRLHADNSSVVVASDEAFAILNRARSLALVPCSCRLTFKNCLKPVNTCINLDASAEESLGTRRGTADLGRGRVRNPGDRQPGGPSAPGYFLSGAGRLCPMLLL